MAGRRSEVVIDEMAPAVMNDGVAERILLRIASSEPRRLMTVEERVAFADDLRSRSRPTDEDSTDLIRRDRDER